MPVWRTHTYQGLRVLVAWMSEPSFMHRDFWRNLPVINNTLNVAGQGLVARQQVLNLALADTPGSSSLVLHVLVILLTVLWTFRRSIMQRSCPHLAPLPDLARFLRYGAPLPLSGFLNDFQESAISSSLLHALGFHNTWQFPH
jgi:hypothetical protein